MLTVYTVVCNRRSGAGATHSTGSRGDQCSLILGHPCTARQKKSKRADSQILVFLHRSLPEIHKFSPKVVQAVFLVKEKMGIFRHIFPCPSGQFLRKKLKKKRYIIMFLTIFDTIVRLR
jgi:hypothetical protein